MIILYYKPENMDETLEKIIQNTLKDYIKIKSEIGVKQKQYNEYNPAYESERTIMKDSIKKLINEKLSISLVDIHLDDDHTGYIKLKDKVGKNNYVFRLNDGVFKMEIEKRDRGFVGGFGGRLHPFFGGGRDSDYFHPSMIFELIDRLETLESKISTLEGIKSTEKEIYEGGNKPEFIPAIDNIYELLKKDMNDKGELTQAIKNHMIGRLEKLNTKTLSEKTIDDEIKLLKKQLNDYSSDNLDVESLFKNEEFLTDDMFNICVRNGGHISYYDSINFKKSIDDTYEIELSTKDTTLIKKVKKSDFKLSHYISFRKIC